MRQFGHQRPVRDGTGHILKMVDSPVSAVTRDELGGSFGKDKHKKVIFTMGAGDVILMRPVGTSRTIRVEAKTVYRYALQCAALSMSRKVKEYKKVMTLKESRKKAKKELGLL